MSEAARSSREAAASSWTIRPVEAADLDELVVLCSEHAAYERADFCPVGKAEALGRRWLAGDGRAGCWVVEIRDRLQGFASYGLEFSTWDAADFLLMDCLYLRPACRGRGVGAEILRRLHAWAGELGCVNLQWQTPDWNVGAIRFYRRHGAQAQKKLRFTLKLDRGGDRSRSGSE